TMDVRPPDLTAEGQSSDTPKKGLPPFSIAILPIIVPLLLIILASANQYFFTGSSDSGLTSFIQFIGNKNVAMLIGTLLALWILARQQEWGLVEVGKSMEKPLEIAGIIILSTSAGGAFGGMIRYCGISEWIQGIVDAGFQMNYILLAWLVAALMKIAQGSGTVSMITSAGILYALINGVELPYHPVYILLSIGFGAMFISWMNDSGFWVVCKLSGFTEKQTLKSWTVTLASIGVVGLILTFLLANVFPMI
ncbi:MAG: GntP family permease, partial [Saprospiraceae bacterium]|nr:GntP family permease [Saprospiraceae bacterium]